MTYQILPPLDKTVSHCYHYPNDRDSTSLCDQRRSTGYLRVTIPAERWIHPYLPRCALCGSASHRPRSLLTRLPIVQYHPMVCLGDSTSARSVVFYRD